MDLISTFVNAIVGIAEDFSEYVSYVTGHPYIPGPPIDPDPDPLPGNEGEEPDPALAWLEPIEPVWSRSKAKALYRIKLAPPSKLYAILKVFITWTKPDDPDRKKLIFGHPPSGRIKLYPGTEVWGYLKAIPGALNKKDPLAYLASDGGAKIEIVDPAEHVIDGWWVVRVGELVNGRLVRY
jgi:hypothetical protein